MTTHPTHAAFMATTDEYCDAVMQTLRLNGQPPRLISIEPRSFNIDATAWRDAQMIVEERGLNPVLGAIKRVSMAARHTRFCQTLRGEGIDLLYVWRGVMGRRALAIRAAASTGVTCVYFERGPLPGWVQIDCKGVNARGSIPRDPRFFRAWRALHPDIEDWRGLKQTLKARTPLRKLVAQHRRDDWNDEGPFLFCPFQMNQRGEQLADAGWVTDPADLVAVLARASRALPDGWHLRLKPHPNARGDLTDLTAPFLSDKFRLDRDTNSLDQLAASRGVITVNSAMGLEAFFHDKPVIVLGDSYYSAGGRTQTAFSQPELDALLADPGALDFDQAARDDLMNFLFNDFFVREEDLKSGRFDVASLMDRHARHNAILSTL